MKTIIPYLNNFKHLQLKVAEKSFDEIFLSDSYKNESHHMEWFNCGFFFLIIIQQCVFIGMHDARQRFYIFFYNDVTGSLNLCPNK